MTAGVLRPPQRRSPAPRYWRSILCGKLGCSERLAQEVWQAYTTLSPQNATLVAFQLALLDTPARTQTEARRRWEHLGELLPVSALLDATEKVSPPGGQRRREVTRLEQTILDHWIDSQGAWLRTEEGR